MTAIEMIHKVLQDIFKEVGETKEQEKEGELRSSLFSLVYPFEGLGGGLGKRVQLH